MFNQISANVEYEKLDLKKLIDNGLNEKSIKYDTKLQNLEDDGEETGGYCSYCSFVISKNKDEYIRYEIEFENFPFYKYDLMLVVVKHFDKKNCKILQEKFWLMKKEKMYKRYIDDIFNYIIEKEGANFADLNLLKIFIRDYNDFIENGIKISELPDRDNFTILF